MTVTPKHSTQRTIDPPNRLMPQPAGRLEHR